MSYGYSQRLVELNKGASIKSLGVALGRVCIKANASVIAVASTLGVSRSTIYNWFSGACHPHPKYYAAINKLIQRYKA
jgi:DNA-binding XRE family transcriptional regulator